MKVRKKKEEREIHGQYNDWIEWCVFLNFYFYSFFFTLKRASLLFETAQWLHAQHYKWTLGRPLCPLYFHRRRRLHSPSCESTVWWSQNDDGYSFFLIHKGKKKKEERRKRNFEFLSDIYIYIYIYAPPCTGKDNSWGLGEGHVGIERTCCEVGTLSRVLVWSILSLPLSYWLCCYLRSCQSKSHLQDRSINIYIYVYIYHLVINNIEGGGGGGKAM
jgi:hypothetical protein